MNAREVAWRMFASELNDSSLVVQGEEERAPTYVITPLGAKVNRVYLVGVVSDLENVGTGDEPRWRAKLIDPTGTTYISAGQFQPEAARAMSKLAVPSFAAVIGKVRVYSPEPDVMYITIAPETIKPVDKMSRNIWVLDGCKALKQRIEAADEAAKLEEPTVDALVKLGYAQGLAEGIVAAKAHYGEVPLDRFRTMLVDALRYLIPEEGGESEELPRAATAEAEPEREEEEYDEFEEGVDTPSAPPKPEACEPAGGEGGDEELTAEESKLLKLLEQLDPKNAAMDWDALEKSAKKAGLKKEAFDKAAEGLLDKGMVYEPVIGRVKKI